MRKFLFCLIQIFFLSCKADKIDFYLPTNYKGEVAILYVENGAEAIFENGRQKIIIPDSGIVFLNQKYTEGQIDYKYYIKTPEGYSKIESFIPGIDSVNGKKYIYFERTMGFDFQDQRGNSLNILGHFFYVGEKLDTSVGKQRFFFENKIQSILINRTAN